MNGKTATELEQLLSRKKISSQEIVKNALADAKKYADHNIFLELDEEFILSQATSSDDRRSQGRIKSQLDGIPIAIKDNICIQGQIASCASEFLKNFRSPYDATVISKLKESGAILFGRTNMDEFAMGSSTENSAFGITRNPKAKDRVPGGSSGGSAAAVSSGIVPLSLGSDTGGSIRQPAALTGVYGMKPTYGRVSRYGLVAFASSLDQIGPFSNSVDDNAMILHILNGSDVKDSTTSPQADDQHITAKVQSLSKDELNKLRIGLYLPEESQKAFDPDVFASTQKLAKQLEGMGAQIVPIQSKLWEYSIAIYYILATAEASSNLSRFDGVRYGVRANNVKNIQDLYIRSRTEGFGPEVKRRILLGTFVLSSGYYDAFYGKAQKAREMIRLEYLDFFKKVDLILQPTSPTTAFKIGAKSDPISMYQSDILTIAANLGGVPSMSIPYAMDQEGLPIGMQLTATHFNENLIYRLAKTIAETSNVETSKGSSEKTSILQKEKPSASLQVSQKVSAPKETKGSVGISVQDSKKQSKKQSKKDSKKQAPPKKDEKVGVKKSVSKIANKNPKITNKNPKKSPKQDSKKEVKKSAKKQTKKSPKKTNKRK